MNVPPEQVSRVRGFARELKEKVDSAQSAVLSAEYHVKEATRKLEETRRDFDFLQEELALYTKRWKDILL